MGTAEIVNDYVSVYGLKDHETIIKLLNDGISKKISICVPSLRSPRLVELTISQIEFIKNAFPSRVQMVIETEIVYKHDKSTDTYYPIDYETSQSISISDLWISKSRASEYLNIPISPKPNPITPPPIVHRAIPIPEAEKASMLKLILGMAIKAYGFDPMEVKNSATGSNKGSIKYDLNKVGLTIDEDTVRKYLKEAKEQYPHARAPEKEKTLMS